MKIRFAIAPAGRFDVTDYVTLVSELEGLGFDTIWLSDVPLGDSIEPIVGLGWAAAATTKLKLGANVVPVGRNPMQLARQLAQLDRLSNGRVLLSLVPGVDQPGERAALGVGKIDRGLLIEEVMGLLRRWWAGEKLDYRSERYDFQGIEVMPTPKQNPLELWLGGNGPKALDRAGRLSDGWLGAFATPVEAGEARRTMQQVAVDHGRHIDDEHFGLSLGYAHADIPEPTFTMMKRRRVNQADVPASDLVPVGAAGLRDLISRHIDNGISKFVLRPIDRTASWHDELSWLADTVLPMQT
ncbi:MAG: LLM class flavin-dependent oxidoreductase [Acidimicrobiia bacterium]